MLKKLPNGMYVDEDQDIERTLPDGRTELIVAKGVPLNEMQAQKAGLIKTREIGPSETKIDPNPALAVNANAPTITPIPPPTGEVVATGTPGAEAGTPAADHAIATTHVSDSGLVDTSTHVLSSEEILPVGSNVNNPRARGNRVSRTT